MHCGLELGMFSVGATQILFECPRLTGQVGSFTHICNYNKFVVAN